MNSSESYDRPRPRARELGLALVILPPGPLPQYHEEMSETFYVFEETLIALIVDEIVLGL